MLSDILNSPSQTIFFNNTERSLKAPFFTKLVSLYSSLFEKLVWQRSRVTCCQITYRLRRKKWDFGKFLCADFDSRVRLFPDFSRSDPEATQTSPFCYSDLETDMKRIIFFYHFFYILFYHSYGIFSFLYSCCWCYHFCRFVLQSDTYTPGKKNRAWNRCVVHRDRRLSTCLFACMHQPLILLLHTARSVWSVANSPSFEHMGINHTFHQRISYGWRLSTGLTIGVISPIFWRC